MPRPVLCEHVFTRSDELEVWMLRKGVLFRWRFVIGVPEEDNITSFLQEIGGVDEQVIIDVLLTVLLFHASVEVVLVTVFHFEANLRPIMLLLVPRYFLVCNAYFLRPCSDSVRRIANDRVEQTTTSQHWPMEVLNEEVGMGKPVMGEVRPNVELFYLIEAFELIGRLSSNSVSLNHPNVQIRAIDKGFKVLHSRSDRSGSHKGIVNKVSHLNGSLIGHQ